MPNGPEVVVIGAGVVGLSCAYFLARTGCEVVVVEQHDGVGRDISSRNSGVIHAGLYYPADSLKSRLCLRGKRLLYDWCQTHQIAHDRCGKLVIATTPEEQQALREIERNAHLAGAGSLQRLDQRELQRREPELLGLEAIWSPTSGIVDTHGFVESLARACREQDVAIALGTRVVHIEADSNEWSLRTQTANVVEESCASWLVNAAGFGATVIAAACGMDIQQNRWTVRPCKGNYFALSRHAPQPNSHLVYPIPTGAGLGIHLTRDTSGRLRAGPDALFDDPSAGVDASSGSPTPSVDEHRAATFAKAVQRYMPALKEEHLIPDFAGVRPKLSGPHEPARDFVVAFQRTDSGPHAVHLVGIESPGLTAALAIGEHVAARFRD